MSLKQTRFHVEPVFHYRGDEVTPFFGEPDEYVERIVDWIKGCKCPQAYGCYTLWKVLHQQKRVDILEDTAEGMSDEIIELYDSKDKHDTQIEELERVVKEQGQELQRLRRDQTKVQETHAQELYCLRTQIEDLLSAVRAQAAETQELRKHVRSLEPVLAQQVESVEVVAFVCDRCGRSYSGNKCSCRISLMDSLRGY